MIVRTLEDGPPRKLLLVFETGEEVIAELARFAEERQLGAAHFTGIGAFRRVTLGFYDLDRQEYLERPLDEQVEVTAVVGNVARAADGGWKVHAHVTVGRRDGEARGGHLLEGVVRPTLELFLTETGEEVWRRHDPETGLTLIR